MIEKNKNVKFELYNVGYEDTIDLLNSGTVDFAIFLASKDQLPKNVTIKEFYKRKFDIGMHKDHPP